MSGRLKTHYPDAIFGRPCCSADNDNVSRELAKVTCKRCKKIVANCERATAQREAERSVGNG